MAKQSKLVKYVEDYLGYELNAISSGPIAQVKSVLSLAERALIYKYSADGYESVNEALRKSRGKDNTTFGELLGITLKKLPDHKGLVYRNVNLSSAELAVYIDACEKSTILVEHSFISASRSISVASMFGGNCRFTMISQSGKAIEEFAKYGIDSGQNEREVLFGPNSKFDVLEVTKMNDHTLIIMEEVNT
jgi:hypothetical protein